MWNVTQACEHAIRVNAVQSGHDLRFAVERLSSLGRNKVLYAQRTGLFGTYGCFPISRFRLACARRTGIAAVLSWRVYVHISSGFCFWFAILSVQAEQDAVSC